MEASMGRGLNIRFISDCMVIVLANDRNLNWNDCCQMVGRSSRRFGLCVGTVYVAMFQVPERMEDGGEEFLRRKENNIANDEGLEIAEQLIKKLKEVTNINMRKRIMECAGNPPKWKVTREDFAQGDERVYKFVTETNYRPNSKW